MLLAYSLVPGLSAAPLPTLGIITSSQAAQIGDARASVGTTLYAGDRLATDQGGWLRVSAANFQLQLQERSSAFLTESPAASTGRGIQLTSGSIEISLTSAADFRVLANGAILRAAGDRPILARIEIRGAREVHISMRRGEMQLVYQAESAILHESKSYAVLLNPSEKEIAFAANLDTEKPKTGHTTGKPVFLLILLAAAAAIALPLLLHSYESPHTP